MHIRVDLMKHELPMFHTENDLLQNLVVTSPKSARKKFRESIFESWEWRCMYCDEAFSNHYLFSKQIKDFSLLS